MADRIRPPKEIVDKWRRATRAETGSIVSHNGRLYKLTGYDACPIGTDLWTGEERVLIMGPYELYVPERITAEELIEMHEKVKQWQTV